MVAWTKEVQVIGGVQIFPGGRKMLIDVVDQSEWDANSEKLEVVSSTADTKYVWCACLDASGNLCTMTAQLNGTTAVTMTNVIGAAETTISKVYSWRITSDNAGATLAAATGVVTLRNKTSVTTLKSVPIGQTYGGRDTGLTLVDQTMFATTATLYIPLWQKVRYAKLAGVKYGYIDTANVNDLATLYLMEQSHVQNEVQQRGLIWSSNETATPVVESLTTAGGHTTWFNPHRSIDLTTRGRVYFATDWTTAVIDCGAATEMFYLVLYGYASTGPYDKVTEG